MFLRRGVEGSSKGGTGMFSIGYFKISVHKSTTSRPPVSTSGSLSLVTLLFEAALLL